MRTRKLELQCPTCGSGEVFYSCTPGCCFNHVCANCGTTFETETVAAGGSATGIVAPDPLPEASDPTAECVKCNSIAVYLLEDGGAVCGKCGTRLRVELTEISAS